MLNWEYGIFLRWKPDEPAAVLTGFFLIKKLVQIPTKDLLVGELSASADREVYKYANKSLKCNTIAKSTPTSVGYPHHPLTRELPPQGKPCLQSFLHLQQFYLFLTYGFAKIIYKIAKARLIYRLPLGEAVSIS